MATVTISPLSRYVSTPLLQDAGGNLYWASWVPIEFPPDSTDTGYQVKNQNEGIRIDLVAYRALGDPAYFWAILEANNISNPIFDLRNKSKAARTYTVIGQYNTEVFYAESLQTGAQFNTGNKSGLSIKVTPTSLQVMLAGQVMETFSNLTAYPMLQGGSEPDPDFWGNIVSKYVEITWVSPYTIRPQDGGQRVAPLPPNNMTYSFWGGVNNRPRALRIPSQQTISKVLNSFA